MMEAPAVQYVKTDDGFDIAYTVAGAGMPFVFMPWPFSHRGLWWRTAFGRPIAEALAARFRLIQYDGRGQGMSTRGLPEYHSVEDYLLDLDAVVERLCLDRFVLYGGPNAFGTAVRYAVRHPGRVSALVLGDVSLDASAFGGRAMEELARGDWNLFLHTMVSSFSLEGAPRELAYWRESVTQEDWLRMVRAGQRSNIAKLLPEVRVPTLILNTRRLGPDESASALAEAGQAFAALIPNSRLILFDGFASVWYANGPEPPAVRTIEDFLKALPAPDSQPPIAVKPVRKLSSREVEVLSLVAEGKTNREIAEALVISERTVINHLSNIFAKTGSENRAGAAAYALRHGLLDSL